MSGRSGAEAAGFEGGGGRSASPSSGAGSVGLFRPKGDGFGSARRFCSARLRREAAAVRKSTLAERRGAAGWITSSLLPAELGSRPDPPAGRRSRVSFRGPSRQDRDRCAGPGGPAWRSRRMFYSPADGSRMNERLFHSRTQIELFLPRWD